MIMIMGDAALPREGHVTRGRSLSSVPYHEEVDTRGLLLAAIVRAVPS